ncbi:allatostatin-A receptor-like [Ptychodera flava]|uniref:allatostatin-A receptor-like n=1 Tax=Ptychodera flava TaxID=63121 RepID=UPI00396A51D9
MNTTHGSNVSAPTPGLPSVSGPEWMYVQTTEVIIAIIGVISNFVVIVVMVGIPTLRCKFTYKMTACLAVSDFISCIFLIPRTMRGMFPIPSGIAGEIYCRTVKATVLWVSLVASTYSLVAITCERYFAIVHPISYNVHKKKIPAWSVVTAVWLLSFVMQSFCVYNNSYSAEMQNCKYQWPLGEWYQTFVGVGLFFSTYFIPILILLVAYCRILVAFRQNESNTGLNNSGTGGKSATVKAKKKVVKMFLVVCLAFAVCWGPNQFIFLLSNFGFNNYSQTFYNFTRILAACNSCINPFVYAVWSKPFRNGVAAIFCCRGQKVSVDSAEEANTQDSRESRTRTTQA